MSIFMQVVERKSFAQAAAALGLSPALISTRIGDLEQHLGVRLLNRTTRRVETTEDGELFYGHCQRVLADIADTDLLLARDRGKPRGLLWVDIPSGIGSVYVLPVMPDFMRRYPDIRLELSLSGRGTELDDKGYDVILRAGPVSDTGLIAHKLTDLRIIRVAAPDYLAQHGMPNKPDDLHNHICLSTGGGITGGGSRRSFDHWIFENGRRRMELRLTQAFVVNSGDALAQMAVAGLGIANISEPLAARYLAEGRLRRVLPDWDVNEATPFSVLYARNNQSPKVRAFVDFVRTEIDWMFSDIDAAR